MQGRVGAALIPGTNEAFNPVTAQWETHPLNAIGYLEAYYQNLVLPVQRLYLRIPGAAEYWHELDVRLSSVLAGETKPKAALDDIYQTWERITEHYGRESQKNLYAESHAG